MRVVVIGAGAVGCYYGGMLARAGHEVTLVGRAGHVEAIRRDGLRMETTTFDERIRLGADTCAESAGAADLILVTVKSGDTEEVGRQLAPIVTPGALVLCLQNGIDNADRLAALLPQAGVEPSVIYVAVEMAGPGHVRHHGRGEIVLGEAALAVRPGLVGEFIAAGIPATVGEVRVALWSKLAANCAWNALSAIADRPYGWLHAIDGSSRVLADVVAECRQVAAAEGIELPGDLLANVESLAESMPAQRSSTAQDLARGRATEIEHLNGVVVRRGALLGVATPANNVLLVLVRACERRLGECL